MIRTLLVDDEFPSLKILENFSLKLAECEIVGKCTSGTEALEFLQKNEVDLLFLDIQMPGMTGIEMLSKLSKRPITVITTANHDKALDAYNLDVVDYLVKPFSFDRFQRSVERAKAQLSYKNSDQKDLLEKPNYITVKSDYKVVKILLDEIRYIEGLGEYVKIVLEKNFVVTLEALKNLEKTLPEQNFVRIHKSYIANTKFVRTITSTSVTLKDGHALPVGKVYKDEVKAKFKH
ncbi:MAG: response regulator transcription factor [Chitinophagales bacterium]|nr:response regulator transcription factor [Chitinophagales bacterium]